MIYGLFGRYLPGYTLKLENNCLYFSKGNYKGYIDVNNKEYHCDYKDKHYKVKFSGEGIMKYSNTITLMKMFIKSENMGNFDDFIYDPKDEDI